MQSKLRRHLRTLGPVLFFSFLVFVVSYYAVVVHLEQNVVIVILLGLVLSSVLYSLNAYAVFYEWMNRDYPEEGNTDTSIVLEQQTQSKPVSKASVDSISTDANQSNQKFVTPRNPGLPLMESSEVDKDMETKPLVVIIYSKKDSKEMEILATQIGVLHQDSIIELWNDEMVLPGENEKQEILSKIEAAKVVIMVITSNYLTTRFILDDAIPLALKRQRTNGTIIIPLITKACPWKKVSWLKNMSVRPRNEKPIWQNSEQYDGQQIANVVYELSDVIN